MNRRTFLLCCLLTLAACDNNTASQAAKPIAEKPAVAVETVLAQRQAVGRTLERAGTLHAQRAVQLSLQQEGVLLELPYHEGDAVTQGSVLAQLDDTLLRAQLKKSRAQRRQAEQDLQRLTQLQSSRVVTEEELARAATALEVARAEEEELRIQLQQARLLAPFDGIISQRLAEPGDTLARFSHLLSLIDTSRLRTELQLSELVLPGLRPGDPVSLTIDALGPKRYSGTILRIHPVVEESSRQGTVEVVLSPPPPGARPGQLCRVTLQLRSRERLLVPYNALRRDTRGEYLFVVNADNVIERREVISGLHFDESVELFAGLEAGERVVTRGFLGLDEGSKVHLGGKPKTP